MLIGLLKTHQGISSVMKCTYVNVGYFKDTFWSIGSKLKCVLGSDTVKDA